MDTGAIIQRFNECISRRDIDGLAELMSAGHTFIDTAGTAIVGRAACLAAWRGFFGAFPGYRNIFTTITAKGSTAVMEGYSECPRHPELAGPALWSATVHDGLLSEWRVYEDTPEVRRALGLNAA